MGHILHSLGFACGSVHLKDGLDPDLDGKFRIVSVIFLAIPVDKGFVYSQVLLDKQGLGPITLINYNYFFNYQWPITNTITMN